MNAGWLGSPAGVVCPRCRRVASGDLPFGDHCSGPVAVFCRRDPFAIVLGDGPFDWAMLFAPRVPVPEYAAAPS